MRKHRKRNVAILAGLLTVLAVKFAWPERQPSYQGRPLTYWLNFKNNDDDDAVRDAPHFEEAIRSMGTNCLPCLVRCIAYEPPAWKNKLINVSVRLRWAPESFQEDREERLAQGAVDAFRVLDRRASPVIPQLVKLVKERSRKASAERAAYVLTSFGLEAQAIVVDMLDDPRPLIRQGAIFRVREFGTNALPGVPKLIAILNGSDDFCAMMAAQTLGELQLRPDLCIPALTNALQSSRFEVALAAHSSLAEFGLVFPIPQDVSSGVLMRKRQP